MTLFLAALLVAGSGQGDAPASNWVDLLALPDGAMTWYDPASIVRGGGGTVRVRMRVVPGRSSVTGARQFNSTEEIDCRRDTATTIALVADMKNGETVPIPVNGEPDAIHPDTPLAALRTIVCAPSPDV